MQNAKETTPPNIHLAVKNFGPIARADIDLRPLTVFVGKSNTGKTYLAALIYALHRTFHVPMKPGDMAGAKSNSGDAAAFEAELKRCFDIDSVSALIRVTDKAACDEMQVRLAVCEADQTHCVFQLRAAKLGIAVKHSIDYSPPWALCEAASFDERSRAYFLPAGRRGLLQAHETGAAAVKANGFSTDFLQQLIGAPEMANGGSAKLRGVAALLKDEVLRGEIEMKPSVQAGYPAFFYRSAKTSRVLRLSHSSSQVSALAPLALFVRGVLRPGDLLIIEEPEAHLHPGAQAAIALTLIRLVRTGVHVIVTTHSDWFLQQLGNTIREGELEKLGERFDEHAEVLRQEDVGVWLFQENMPVEEIPFNSIEGVEPQEYGDIAEELYNTTVNLRARFRERTGESKGEHESEP